MITYRVSLHCCIDGCEEVITGAEFTYSSDWHVQLQEARKYASVKGWIFAGTDFCGKHAKTIGQLLAKIKESEGGNES